jgi:hypothetical protein
MIENMGHPIPPVWPILIPNVDCCGDGSDTPASLRIDLHDFALACSNGGDGRGCLYDRSYDGSYFVDYVSPCVWHYQDYSAYFDVGWLSDYLFGTCYPVAPPTRAVCGGLLITVSATGGYWHLTMAHLTSNWSGYQIVFFDSGIFPIHQTNCYEVILPNWQSLGGYARIRTAS